MKNIHRSLVLILTVVLMQACATTPKFDTSNVEIDVTPQRAADGANALQGIRVLWGGVIIASSNLKDATQLEVLAYPLAPNQRPDIDKAPLGRFLARQTGFLETTDYAQGRLITLSGLLREPREGRIGESEYTYPVVEIDRLHLWPKQRGGSPETRFQFGLGVIFSN